MLRDYRKANASFEKHRPVLKHEMLDDNESDDDDENESDGDGDVVSKYDKQSNKYE